MVLPAGCPRSVGVLAGSCWTKDKVPAIARGCGGGGGGGGGRRGYTYITYIHVSSFLRLSGTGLWTDLHDSLMSNVCVSWFTLLIDQGPWCDFGTNLILT